MSEQTALDELTKAAETLSNSYIEEWKQQGKNVLAYNCSFMPVEIIQAAGLLPFRLKGTESTGTALADSFLSTVNCSFCRSCLDLLLQGKYDFLDGAVFVDSCDHMHVTYANWKAQNKTPFMENIVSVPHIITQYGQDYFTEELNHIKNKIADHFKIVITDEQLRVAITACNETRRLQKKLYDHLMGDAPSITGSQGLSIIVAGATIPVDQYNRLLAQLLLELKNRESVAHGKHRLMVAGSVFDNPDLLKIIEETGGQVVSDTLCLGSRFFMEPVKEDGDPLSALAAGYYHQIQCPRMFDSYQQRFNLMLDIARQSKAAGVILQSIKGCDCHGIDNVMAKRDFESNGIPVLVLEREYDVLADAGRLRTRVQAFLEKIGGTK